MVRDTQKRWSAVLESMFLSVQVEFYMHAVVYGWVVASPPALRAGAPAAMAREVQL